MNKTLNINKLATSIRLLLSPLVIILFQCCAPVSIQPPHPPFDHQTVVHIVSSFEEQERAVHTFFSSGQLMVERHGSEFEANTLIVGVRDPFKIKIEITHPWGRPLFHILIDKTRVHILSFPEKRYYLGYLGNFALSSFFPVGLDPEQLWAFVRGYPILCEHNRAVSLKGNQITLLNGEGDVIQLIDFYPENNFPSQTVLPWQGIKMSFSDFENDNNIHYARKTRLFDQEAETTLALNLKQTVLNKAIQESSFELAPPHDFKRFHDGVLLDTQ